MAKAEKKLVLKRSQLVGLFLAIGIDVAPKWTVSRLQEKTVALNLIVDEDTKVPAECQEIFETVMKLIEKKIPFSIEDDGNGAPEKSKKEDAPASKSKSKKAKKEEVEEEVEADDEEEEDSDDDEDADDTDEADADDEEDEDSDDDEDKPAAKSKSKPAAKSKSKKAKKEEVEVEADDDEEIEDGPAPKAARKKVKAAIDPSTPKKNPGVISLIVGMLKEGFISKEEVLKRLCKELPDREESAMKQTVNTQIPSRLKQTYCLQKSDGKFRITDGKPGFTEVENTPAKSKKAKKEEVEADDDEEEVEEKPAKKSKKKK